MSKTNKKERNPEKVRLMKEKKKIKNFKLFISEELEDLDIEPKAKKFKNFE